jgi:hypothetical protein
MLRIRYEGRKTVFEYRGIPKSAVDEQIAGHINAFGIETVHEGPKKVPVRRPIDQTKLIAEWVENEGTEAETVTRLDVPGVAPPV